MYSTGTVRVGVCLAILITLPLGGSAAGGDSPELLAEALLASDSAPLPLLALAHGESFSPVPLSYLPGHDWGLSTPARPFTPLPRLPERSEGLPVEIGGDYADRYEYCDTFADGWHREDASIDGLSALRWDRDGGALELRGSPERRQVSLLYHFVSPYKVKDLVAELEGEIAGGGSDRLELAMSPDGEAFGHAVGVFGREEGQRFHLTTNASTQYEGGGFWVRITGELSPGSRVRLTAFRTAGRVKPPLRPEVALQPGGEERLCYRDTFRSRKIFHLAEIENPDALEWHRGHVRLRSQQGQPARVAVRQRFVSPEPLRALTVRIRNAAGEAGAANQFALSLDGHTLLAVQATPGGPFDGVTELRLDPRLLADARQFYVHMRLGGSGASPAASTVSDLQVEALMAQPPAATAAAPAAAPTHH